jgi:hypothetical protein
MQSLVANFSSDLTDRFVSPSSTGNNHVLVVYITMASSSAISPDRNDERTGAVRNMAFDKLLVLVIDSVPNTNCFGLLRLHGLIIRVGLTPEKNLQEVRCGDMRPIGPLDTLYSKTRAVSKATKRMNERSIQKFMVPFSQRYSSFCRSTIWVSLSNL